MPRNKKYKPIKEDNYWDAREKYGNMRQSGELFEKYPDMVGMWAYDMPKFLELSETIQALEEEEQKEEKPNEDNKSIWFDKKE